MDKKDKEENFHCTAEILDEMPEQMRWSFIDRLTQHTKNETR